MHDLEHEIKDKNREFTTCDIMINPGRHRKTSRYLTDLVTKHRLISYRYKGFTKLEKITDTTALLSHNEDLIFIEGNFKRLENKKVYPIGDIIENRR